MPEVTNTQLAAQITALLVKWNGREAELRDWIGGSPSGGPNGDGRYPMTNASGETSLIDCPAKLADTLNGPAVTAGAHADAAEVSAASAANEAVAAAASVTLASAYKSDSQQARDMALEYRDQAASHAANAQAHREAAEVARDETLAALAAWEAAHG